MHVPGTFEATSSSGNLHRSPKRLLSPPARDRARKIYLQRDVDTECYPEVALRADQEEQAAVFHARRVKHQLDHFHVIERCVVSNATGRAIIAQKVCLTEMFIGYCHAWLASPMRPCMDLRRQHGTLY